METAFPDFNRLHYYPFQNQKVVPDLPVLEYKYVLKQTKTKLSTEISLPGQKPSSTLFQRPSTVVGTPWRGPAPAGARAVQW